MVMADRKPKSLLGKKFELTMMKKPAESIRDVETIAFPVVRSVCSFASR